ncbi:MAG: tyrosine--tRNA ligase [bacterium]|nr:tyrosine--tRNA ligase [bacterium]
MSDFQELLTRGVEEVIDREHLESSLASGKKLRVKLGIDPTSPNIHIGRAVVLWKLRAFQDLGHKIVFIVGDFTGLVGDTSDKDAERPMLTEAEVKTNMKTYFDQAFKILDSKQTETHYNSEWLNKLGFLEISKMADKFGLHEFSSRELIKKRLDAGKRVSLRELMYPLMQGYDSVAVRADVELGGTDQRFNLLAGRTIQPLYGQGPQDILITKLLEGTDHRKMSSSWGNVINITDEPNDMFGKVMSISDDVMVRYFERATRVPLQEIDEIKKELEAGSSPLDVKKKLAREIVTLYYGDKTARKAQDEFEKVFSEGKNPEEIKGAENRENITQTIVASGVVTSNSEVKRLIDQKAVKVNDKVIDDWGYKLNKGDIVKIGPRKFIKIQ